MLLSRFLLSMTLIVTLCASCSEVRAEPNLMSFEGQVFALCSEIKFALEKDKVLKDVKTIRLGRFVCNQSDEVNFEPRILRELEKNLGDLIDKKSKTTLSGEYSFVTSSSADNAGLGVIVIRLSIRDAKDAELAKYIRRSKADSEPEETAGTDNKSAETTEGSDAESKEFVREINRTSDIAIMLGSTIDFDKKSNLAERNKLVSSSFESPSFGLIEGSKTQVTTTGGKRFGVEIIKRSATIDAPKDPDAREKIMSTVEPSDSSGLAYVPISIGEIYAIRLYNYDRTKVAVAKVLIDGLDAVNTYNEDTITLEGGAKIPQKYSGFTLPKASTSKPGKAIAWGWLRTVDPKSTKNAYEFVVNKLGEGAASEKLATTGTGVITVEFYEEQSGTRGTRGVDQPGETGKGDAIKLELKTEEIPIAKEPSAIISIRYSPARK